MGRDRGRAELRRRRRRRLLRRRGRRGGARGDGPAGHGRGLPPGPAGPAPERPGQPGRHALPQPDRLRPDCVAHGWATSCPTPSALGDVSTVGGRLAQFLSAKVRSLAGRGHLHHAQQQAIDWTTASPSNYTAPATAASWYATGSPTCYPAAPLVVTNDGLAPSTAPPTPPSPTRGQRPGRPLAPLAMGVAASNAGTHAEQRCRRSRRAAGDRRGQLHRARRLLPGHLPPRATSSG